jgi:hypothetical protein
MTKQDQRIRQDKKNKPKLSIKEKKEKKAKKQSDKKGLIPEK